MSKLSIFFLFVVFYSLNNLFSQSNIIHYTVDDGLPSSNVYSTFQDSKGFIWVCTDKGLARFDGYSFEVFTVKDGLPYNDVWGVQEDLDGNIWLMSYASHFTHFSYVDNKFHVLENPYLNSSKYLINSFNQSKNNEIFVTMNSTHFCFKIKFNEIKRVELFNVGFIIRNNINTEFGKFISTSSSNVGFNVHIKLYDSVININDINMFRNKNTDNILFWNNYFFNINDSFKIYDINNKRFIKHGLLFISEDEFVSYSFFNKSKLIVILNDKFIMFDKNLNNFVLYFPIEYNLVNNIFQSNDSLIWISTKNEGLYLIGSIGNKNLYFENKQINKMVLKGQNLAYSNNSNNLYFINLNSKIKTILKFPNNGIKDFKYINNNEIIVTNYTKLGFFINELNKPIMKNEKYKRIVENDHFTDVKKIFNYKDSLLILTHYNKISCINLYKNIYKLFLFNLKRFNSAIADSNDVIWLASSSGLSKVLTDSTTDELISLKQKYPLLSKSILDMQPDNQNRIWCGTDGYGLYAFKNNTVNVVEELKNEIINQVHIDFRQHVWVSTNKGGFRIILEKEYPFTYQIKKFSIAQGLPTNEVNCIFADTNFAYFGTQKGLGVVDLRTINLNHAPAPFYLKYIITNKDTLLKGPIVLPYNQSRLEFDFVCLSFKSNKNIVYYYRMQGIDSVWRSTDQLKVIYPILPPGKYTFFIKAKDIDDVFTETKSVEIEITPPFWDTLWFKLTVTFALFFSGLLYLAFRIRAIKIKEMENTVVNKKMAELELQALQSQMNPHFMFNSLNAIQNFILNRTSDDASTYLGKFSKLMRLFLESSRNKYITIAEEIELIQLYVEMELIRYNNKFTAEIICENHQLFNQEIPSMLIQPFVENAINHGLVLKKEEGHLIVKFWNDNEKIYMMVDDDGIGRDKAMEIKKKSIQGYVSRALEITNDRLQTMNTLDDLNLKIDIIDKTDDEGNSIGTKIMIELNNLD